MPMIFPNSSLVTCLSQKQELIPIQLVVIIVTPTPDFIWATVEHEQFSSFHFKKWDTVKALPWFPLLAVF